MSTDEFHGATKAQIEDLLSGDRARVKAAFDQVPRTELVWALSTEAGEQALAHAFELMPGYYVAGRFAEPVLVRYRVERDAAHAIERDVTFGPQDCAVAAVDRNHTPALIVAMDALSFVEAATGTTRGMELLLRGDLNLQGDVQIAMKMEAYFGLAPGRTR